MLHILIVEDRAVYVRKLLLICKKLGHSTSIAQSYTEAIREFGEKIPNLIICDNDLNADEVMTDGDDAGFYFITKIREQGFGGRIILYTGNPRTYFQGELDISKCDVRFIKKIINRH